MKIGLGFVPAALLAVAIVFSGVATAQSTDNSAAANKLPGGGASTSGVVTSNSISSAGLPTEVARLTRDGIPSSCVAVKAFPGTTAGAGFAFQTINYTNTGPARCVTLTLNASCSGGGNLFGAFLSAYSGPFNPANAATNYLGDAGSSVGDPATPGPTPLQLSLAAGQAITLVVNQVNDSATNPANVCGYLIYDDLSVVPTMSPLAMLLMALVLSAVAFVTLRRRA